MNQWSNIPMFIGSASFGAFALFGVRGNVFLTAAFGVLILVCIIGYYVIRKGEIELGEEEAVPQPRPGTPVRQRAGHQVRYAPPGVRRYRNTPPQAGAFESGLANAQAYAGLAAEMAAEAVNNTAAAYAADPKYGRLIVTAVLTVFTVVGSMLGWWAPWKGYHLAGVLALLSVWLYARKHDQTSELLEFISRNKVAFWLGTSVVMGIASAAHTWDPVLTLVFALSAVTATITFFGWWGPIGAAIKAEPLWSAVVGSLAVAVLVVIINEYSKLRGVRISPEFASVGSAIFVVCIAVFSIAAIILWKGKKTN